MNLILLFPEDESAVNEVTLTDHRAVHIHEILKGKPEQKIRVGFLNKGQGLATILSCDKKKTILKVGPLSPSKKSPLSEVTLLIALPRPQTLKKVLETAATFGVGELIFIKTERVEKVFSNRLFSKTNHI
ncbi:MAG: RsmE family RNA methyltransferase [Deltaproteobacteria bacterium]|nr:MAG: RsmE family RNA methyltransferase [Deltaproteobacteria bacterium]